MAAKKASVKDAAHAAKEAPNPEEVPNGFVVVKEQTDEGLNVSFFPVGDTQVTEAVTLLGMAYTAAKRQVGLE